jgi:protein O-mannosyl-transferase
MSAPDRSRRRALALLVAAASLAAFAPTLDNGFVKWDDPLYILDNRWIRGLSWENLRWMMSATRGGLWHPLTWLSLALDHAVWGLEPAGYHLTSVVVHAATAALFFAVCLRLLKDDVAAAFGALFFAVHPLRVESVAWAVERKDVLSGLFFTAALLAHLKAAEPARERARAWQAAAYAAFALSLASKIAGLTLPAVLLLLEVFALRRLPADPRRWLDAKPRAVLLRLLPYALLSLLAGLAAVEIAKIEGSTPYLAGRGLAWRVGQPLYGLLFYPLKTLWPASLSAYYAPMPWFRAWSREHLICGGLVLGSALALLRLSRRRPALGVAFLAYAVMIAPASGVLQHGMVFSACDRYSYLPCLAFAVLFGAAFVRAGAARRALAACWLAALGALTWRQSGVWRDTVTLWESASANAPGGFTLASAGVARLERGQRARGRALLESAIAFDPDMVLSYVNLGVELHRTGDREGAVRLWRRGLRRASTQDLHAALGHALARGSDSEAVEGLAHLRAAVTLSPRSASWRLYLAEALARTGRDAEAEKEYAAALELDPDLGQAENNWGLLLARRGKREEAARHYRAALRRPGARAEANANWGNLRLASGETQKAERQFLEALRLDPGLARAQVNLGNILARRGLLSEAAARYRLALKKDPGLREAGANLEAVRRALER